MQTCIISGTIPPTICGVGDHTFQLARKLAFLGDKVTVLTSKNQSAENSEFSFTIRNVVPSWGLSNISFIVREILEIKPDRILVQWVPHLYHRWGMSLGLSFAILILKYRGFRIQIMAHELWVPFDRFLHLFSGLIQRLAVGILVASSYRFSVSIKAFEDILLAWFPWKRSGIFCVPVGSNIMPEATLDRAFLRASFMKMPLNAPVIALFSPAGNGRDLILTQQIFSILNRKIPTLRWICIGATREQMQDTLPILCRNSNCQFTGILSAKDVSWWFQGSDLLLSPFTDGMSTRRGSVIAAMAHGLPVATTWGRLTDLELFLKSPLLATAGSAENLAEKIIPILKNPELRKSVASQTKSFFEKNFTWDKIAGQLFDLAPFESEKYSMLHRSRL